MAEGMSVIVSGILWITYFISLFFAIFWLFVLLENKPFRKPKPIKTYPKVSIIIPSYNEEDTLLGTVESAIMLDYPQDRIEFIIVNDGSKDRTGEIAEELKAKHHDKHIIIINQVNKGKGAALNAGIAIASGEFVVCLDADSFVESDALKKMLPHFRDEDDDFPDSANIAAVLPSLKVRQPSNILQKMQWYEYIINMFYKELMARLDSVHVAPGPFSIYRKTIVQNVGGFDENHNLTEDLEMALRLQSKNYRLIQVLDTEVHTIAPDNIRALYRQRNRWYKGSIINALRYRRMMFNRKYGDFGMIQMPTILISGMIALTLILSMIYYSIKPYVLYYQKLRHVDFDILTFIRTYRFDFNILDINFQILFVAVAMILITLFVVKRSHVSVNEKVMKFGIFSFIIYALLYFFMLATMWIGIAFDLIIGKKQKW